jgi:TPR repeat protein
MLYSGERIGRDAPRAQALYRRTCDGGIAADCYTLARTLPKTPAERRNAFELDSKACAGNVAAACHEVAVAWESGRELMKAVPFYRKACTGGHAASCERVKKLDE